MRLNALVAAGRLEEDPRQARLAGRLDRLLHALRQKRVATKSSALGWLFAAKSARPEPVKGLYIHGPVGCGKTMLMDVFFELVPARRKRRAHFSDFMADVHERIHAYRQKVGGRRGQGRRPDPARCRGTHGSGLGALLRRILRDRHHGRDDPVAPLHRAFPPRLRARRDIERGPGRSLPRRAQPRTVPALRRPSEAACGGIRARGRDGLPAGEAGAPARLPSRPSTSGRGREWTRPGARRPRANRSARSA